MEENENLKGQKWNFYLTRSCRVPFSECGDSRSMDITISLFRYIVEYGESLLGGFSEFNTDAEKFKKHPWLLN